MEENTMKDKTLIKYYTLTFLDRKSNKRRVYMRTGFETKKQARQEFSRIKKESKIGGKWDNRTEWMLETSEFRTITKTERLF